MLWIKEPQETGSSAPQHAAGIPYEGRYGDARLGQAAAQVVAERLTTAIAALESLRLDLMRLQAGQGSMDDLTADLEAAREIGAEIDRLVAGQKEVAEMLGDATAAGPNRP